MKNNDYTIEIFSLISMILIVMTAIIISIDREKCKVYSNYSTYIQCTYGDFIYDDEE